MLGLPIVAHEEDRHLAGRGCVHEGAVATRLGLPGIPREAEDTMVARDIALVRLTGGRLHVCHVSSRHTVELIRRAKEEGLPVTAEVTPHHLTLTVEAVEGYDTNFKMNPPLRESDDREALIEGLLDGTLDCIATDHAPHSEIRKEVEFDQAPFGVTGLETALGICLTDLVLPGRVPLATVIRALGPAPAALLGERWGPLTDGAPADLVAIDLERLWTVRREGFLSKSVNSSFLGRELTGAALLTLVDGRVAWCDPSLVPRPRPVAAVR
jgi:dihydroorotase